MERDEKPILIMRWLENQCDGKYWRDYLSSYHYHRISIYGAGYLGCCLARELKNSSIEIVEFIDQRAREMNKIMNIPVVTIDEFINSHNVRDNKTEAVIVSIMAYDNIMNQLLREIPEMPVMSLRDMIYEM